MLVVGLEDANTGVSPKASKEGVPRTKGDELGLETASRRRGIRGRSKSEGVRSITGVYDIGNYVHVLPLCIGDRMFSVLKVYGDS